MLKISEEQFLAGPVKLLKNLLDEGKTSAGHVYLLLKSNNIYLTISQANSLMAILKNSGKTTS